MSSSDGGDGGPGAREVAHRVFAAEFDDADFDYSESDEERAPNYVVTPTGLRVNRLFTVGVLTEVETVNEQTLRGRVVDPSGAFVTYAGQYQPDEMAFLDRTSPPAFVALTGKARTFQPEDSDLVYTSVRPESFATVDADTRDRWVVSAAEATLRRIAVFAAALEAEERGDALRARLEAAGVPTALAAGIPLAIDHYGTGTRYLEAVRTLAVDALEVVADERDQVRDLTADPGDRGEEALGPLPDVPYDVAGASVAVDASESADGDAAAAETEAAASTDSLTTDADGASETETAAEPAEAVGDEPSSADVAEADPGAGSEPEPVESASASDEATDSDESPTSDASATESTDAAASTESLTETPAESDATAAADTTADTTADTPTDTASEPAEAAGADTDDAAAAEVDPGAGAEPEPVESDGDEFGGLGDFEDTDDGLGDFEDTESSAEADDGAPAVDPDADPEDFEDALSDEERREVEEEHGVEFATGSEVPDPGEAGIETPDPEDVAPEEDGDASADVDVDADPESAAAGTEPATEDATDQTSAVEEETAGDAGDDAAEGTPDAADVDLEEAVVDLMSELDDGDGADHDAVVAAAVDRYGAAEADVEDAIEGALMSGMCFEPSDGTLKAI